MAQGAAPDRGRGPRPQRGLCRRGLACLARGAPGRRSLASSRERKRSLSRRRATADAGYPPRRRGHHRSRPGAAHGGRTAAIRRLSAPATDQPDCPAHGRRRSSDQADRAHDRVQPRPDPPDHPRRARRRVPCPPEQPDPLVAASGAAMGRWLPKWCAVVAPAPRRRVRRQPSGGRRMGDTATAHRDGEAVRQREVSAPPAGSRSS